MASPQAYEQPTINRAWEDFIAHIPTMLLIWIASVAVGVLGFLASLAFSITAAWLSGNSSDAVLPSLFGIAGQFPFLIISSLLGVLFIAVPALYYNSGEVITINAAFSALLQRPLRYLLAGILFSVATTIGFLVCIIPGIVIALTMPLYVNRIFLGNEPILDAFSGSFQAVYRSANGMNFVGIEILAWLLVALVSICTCGLGALVAVPVSSFYLQNAAYHKGLIS